MYTFYLLMERKFRIEFFFSYSYSYFYISMVYILYTHQV